MPAPIGSRFPALRHHWAVFREAWAAQGQADKCHQEKLDHQFLPAALEIIETPPSPGLRFLLWTLCSLFMIAVIWACIGRIDVVAIASGKVVPAGSVKVIQPLEIGSIRAIHVHNGQHVRKGQLLIELDPTITGADETQARTAQISADITKARNDAILAYLAGKSHTLRAPANTPPEVARNQEQFLKTAIAQFEAERSSLLQSRAEQAAELTGARAELTKLEQTLPLVKRQLKARQDLEAKGYFSRLKTSEYEQQLIEHIQNIEVQRSNTVKASASIANLDSQMRKLKETFGREAVTDLSEATDKSAIAGEDLRKASQRRAFQQIRAPVDGTVQQLVVYTVGGVVQPAQPLMMIVPDDADIAVEAMIPNRDVGFIREGQPVRVKLEAFPFTEYGFVEGTVETISRDAIEQEQSKGPSPAGSPQQSLVYAVRIKLASKSLMIGRRLQPIGPGLAVQAEIKTGKRRIIQYLLSPISKTLDEAARER